MKNKKNFRVITDEGVEIFYGHKINKDSTSINSKKIKFLFPLKYANFQIKWLIEDGSFETKQLGAGMLCVIPPLLTYEVRCLNSSMIEIDIPVGFIESQTNVSLTNQEGSLKEFIGVSDVFLYKLAQFIEYKIPKISPHYGIFINGVLSLLSHYYISNYTDNIETKDNPVQFDEIPCIKIQNALNFMYLNLDRLLNLDEISSEIELSKFHFSRVFKKVIGVSPLKYHMQLRLNAAQEMLRANKNIADISSELGFSSQSHFTTIFTKAIGMLPKSFKDQT